MTNNKTPSQYTLADFVEDNHKLLTVFGVFVAITTFANNLPSKSGRILSFSALLATVILGMELYGKFLRVVERGGDPTVKLWFFLGALVQCISAVFLYWLYDYTDLLSGMISVLLPSVLFVVMVNYVATRHLHLFYRLIKDRVFLIWSILVYFDLYLLITQLTPLIAQWLRQALLLPLLTNTR